MVEDKCHVALLSTARLFVEVSAHLSTVIVKSANINPRSYEKAEILYQPLGSSFDMDRQNSHGLIGLVAACARKPIASNRDMCIATSKNPGAPPSKTKITGIR